MSRSDSSSEPDVIEYYDTSSIDDSSDEDGSIDFDLDHLDEESGAPIREVFDRIGIDQENPQLHVMEGDDESNDQMEQAPETPAAEFDINSSSTHSYMFNDETVEISSLDFLREDQSHVLPAMLTGHVIFPGQSLPVITSCPFSLGMLRDVLKTNFIVLITSLDWHDPASGMVNIPGFPFISVIARITKYQENLAQHSLKAEMVCVYRCLVHELNSAGMSQHKRTARVTIIQENVLPSIAKTCLFNTTLRLPLKSRLRMCEASSNFPSFIANYGTKERCESLVKQLKLWFDEKTLLHQLALGEVHFSYWLCNNLPIDIPMKYALLSINDADSRVLRLAAICEQLTEIVCNQCDTRLCDVSHMLKMSTEGTGGHFVNAGGHVHDLLTVSKLRNFDREGHPESEYCWFPGYKWQILVCQTCKRHIGWEYTSKTFNPPKFYGLTRSNIKPSVRDIFDRIDDDDFYDDFPELRPPPVVIDTGPIAGVFHSWTVATMNNRRRDS